MPRYTTIKHNKQNCKKLYLSRLLRHFRYYKTKQNIEICSGNNPMVGATVAVAVAVEEAMKA